MDSGASLRGSFASPRTSEGAGGQSQKRKNSTHRQTPKTSRGEGLDCGSGGLEILLDLFVAHDCCLVSVVRSEAREAGSLRHAKYE
jgi:hypothetical protein